MRQYLFQSVVDFIALVIALFLATVLTLITDGQVVPGDIFVSIQSDRPLLATVVIFSIVLTAIHWFVRPLLLIFFGGWLMRSFGYVEDERGLFALKLKLELTRAFMRALIKQVFIDGFFHGDPHPGNIVLDRDTGALTYLDLGLVGRSHFRVGCLGW
jgi:ABC1 atypical kinase-like domain